MIERHIDVTTPDGTMPTLVFHPEHDGPHPVVLYLMDAPSIRPALTDMARRLASAGYYVMLPFLYYRVAPFSDLGLTDEQAHNRAELMASITPTNIVGDAAALLAVAADDEHADPSSVGTIGFCMSGGLAVAVAKAFPEQVRAAASIHGAWLVRDGDDSPHHGVQALTAELYFAWVAGDETAPEDTLDAMRAALAAAGVRHTIDYIETGALHGFAPAGPRYDLAASELHWERVHSLLRRNLPHG